jgi:hypothetical protein
MEELIKALQAKLGDEVVSEELINDLQSQFDVMVNEKVQKIVTVKETELEEKSAEEMSDFKDSLIESLDKYIEYASEEYLKENEIAIEAGAKVEAAEKIIEATKFVLEQVGQEIPEAKVDYVKGMETKVEESTNKLNEAVEANIENKAQMFEYEKAIAFQKATGELTESKVEEVHTLLEGLEFKDIGDFDRKVKIVMGKVTEAKETVINENTDDKNKENLENLEEDDNKKVVSSIDKYLV